MRKHTDMPWPIIYIYISKTVDILEFSEYFSTVKVINSSIFSIFPQSVVIIIEQNYHQ